MKALAALLLIAPLSVTLLTGCEDDDVGVPCQLPIVGSGTGTGSGPANPIVVTNALDCLSRLCVRPATTSPEAKGLCSKICGSDDDCPESGTYCPHGERFVCQAVQATGSLHHCKMCVCNAFVSGTTGVGEGENPNCPSL